MKNDSKLRDVLKKYRHAWALIYACIYMTWFGYLEKHVTASYHVMHCKLDSLIPFNEYFIVPYMFWFVYIFSMLVYLVRKDADEFYRYGFYLAAGMSICLFICQIFPNGTAPDFRPAVDPGKNWACALVDLIYRSDTNTNVFPSIHVYNAIGTHIAISRSKHFANRPWIRIVSFFAAVLICISTMFLKQHSAIDVAAGCVLSYFMFHLVYGKIPVPAMPKVPELVKKKEKKKVWA